MAKRPVIGLTPAFKSIENRLYINKGYADGINFGGGLAILLPLVTDESTIEEALSVCDGLLLTGGPDVDARLFGEENLNCNGEISPYRDTMEVFAARKAVEQGMPVLGICRGMQLLNVALGGTMYQDIYRQDAPGGGKIALKHWQEAPDWYAVHEVEIESESLLYRCFNKHQIGVNSFHHQAVKDVPPEIKITARSSDGIVEGIQHKKSGTFVLGVQWHPELMWRESADQQSLFKAFIDACARRF